MTRIQFCYGSRVAEPIVVQLQPGLQIQLQFSNLPIGCKLGTGVLGNLHPLSASLGPVQFRVEQNRSTQPMIEQILHYLEYAGHGISLAAVAVIVVGFALAAVHFALRFRNLKGKRDFKLFKIELGSALTLALEILVLADVIETITTEPTLLSLSVLASLVVIRTILNWTLSLETEGHWPWQSSTEENGGQQDA